MGLRLIRMVRYVWRKRLELEGDDWGMKWDWGNGVGVYKG